MPELDTPPVIPPQIIPENSDDAVRARFNTAMKEVPPDQRGNIVVRDEPQADKPPVDKTPDPKVDPKKDAKGELDIPSEFFDPPKQEVDEWEKITNEEQKGHIKSEDWKNYKKLTAAKVEALRKEKEELLNKLPKDDFVPEKVQKRLEKLEKDLQERDQIINRKYVQESPEFKEKFGSRETLLKNRLEKLGKEAGLEPDQINSILNSSMKRRFDLLEEIENGAAKTSITHILSDLDILQDEKGLYLEEKEKSNISWQEQQDQLTDQQKAKQKELYDYAFNEVLEEISQKFPALKKIPGNEAWNKAVDEDIALARDMYNGKDFTPQRDAEMFLAAASAKRLMKMFENAKHRAVSAEKELADLKAAGPSASQAQDGKNGDPTKDMTPDERARYTFNKAKSEATNDGFRGFRG